MIDVGGDFEREKELANRASFAEVRRKLSIVVALEVADEFSERNTDEPGFSKTEHVLSGIPFEPAVVECVHEASW